MVRTVNKKYQVWLAGYYDDFNGARAIPDDTNSPGSTRAHGNSHHGNPMNGEATLNPRYRWAEPDRDQTGSNLYAPATDKFLQNDGVFEYISYDDTRQSSNEWEGRAQLQYPDGHVANRYRFAGSGSVGYQRFVNGHDTIGSYLVPTGRNDATFGRAAMNGYTSGLFEDATGGQSNAGVTDTTGNFVQRAHLAGVWMGEQFQETSSNTPNTLFAEVTSPAKKPFLVVQSSRWDSTDNQNTPTLIYDGPLNTRLDGDVFTTRICLRTLTGAGPTNWNKINLQFEIGFATPTSALTDTGFSGTPAVDFTIPINDTGTTISPNITYDQIGLLYNDLGVEQSYTNDDAWLDIDFVMDYSNSRYDIYVNGTRVKQNQAMNGTPTAANLYGYQITVKNNSSHTQMGYVSYLMVDRVGMVRYLTDNVTGDTDDAPITSLKMSRSVNGISSCQVKVSDIPDLHSDGIRGSVAANYAHNLKELFVATTALDWNLLIFGDTDNRIDRPLWRGAVEKFNITQKARDRNLTFDARDSLSVMDRTVPLWEVGQEALNDSEEDTPYWLYEAKGFKDVMNMGVRQLKLLNNDIGFDVDSGHIETSTQRTQLGSGHPIQMYNNENSVYGPNDVENYYEGLGVTCVYKNASGHTVVELERNPGTLTTGINFINFTNHNATGKTVSTQSADGKTLTFDGSTAAETLTFTGETAKIIYMGKAWGPFFDYQLYTNVPPYNQQWPGIDSTHPNSTYYGTFGNAADLHFIFDADPGLSVGDEFAVNGQNDAGATTVPTAYIGKHKVKQIQTTKSYFNDTISGTNDAKIWWVKTHTQYQTTNGGELGDYSNNILLYSTARVSFSKDKGNIDTVEELPYRALHARWMRDLPDSLWFQYHFGVINKDAVNNANLAQQAISASQTLTSSSNKLQVTSTTYSNVPQYGVAEIWQWNGTGPVNSNNLVFRGKFVYQGKVTSGGNYYLIGCKYMPTISVGVVSTYYLKVRSMQEDYKHIWLLWSDMRNNGKADADGSERKKDFGLQHPVSENYEVDMFYVDQTDADGNIDKFASLKVGEDIDIWNVDATTDPVTNIPFSKPADYATARAVTAISNAGGKLRISTGTTTGVVAGDYVHLVGTQDHDGGHIVDSVSAGSSITTTTTFVSTTLSVSGTALYYPTTGSEEDLSQYQDWENKAGAFLVVDSSPFFNLNTNSNDGKTGQEAGGTTDLIDYTANSKGQPTLIDNYWAEAITSHLTTGNKGLTHPNAQYIISEATFVSDLDNNQTYLNTNYLALPVNDASIFTQNGYGQMRAVLDNNENVQDFYFSWTGRIESELGAFSVATAGSSATFEGRTTQEITVSGTPNFDLNGVKEGMVVVRTKGGVDTIHNILNLGETNDSNQGNTLIVQGSDWDNTCTFKIPPQLGKVYMTELTENEINLALASRTGFEDAIRNKFNAEQGSTWDIFGLKASREASKRVEVHPTIGSAFMLRLMMHMDGFIKSRNSGTFFENDKIRALWNAAITDSWLPPTRLTAMYDINNVPNTSIMTTYNDTTSNDSYGSMLDTRNKTLASILSSMKQNSGFGDTNEIKTTFSYLVGHDNRLEFRPKYNSHLSFDRQNMKIANFSSVTTSQITNVRVYYNGGSSFVDHPKPATTDTTRWRILEKPAITSGEEALFLAKQEYNKNQNAPMSLAIEPILESDVSHKMIEKGRYGYIADPYIALKGKEANVASEYKYVTNWTRLGGGGALFPGMVNALDGNQATTTDIYARYGSSAVDNTDSSITYTENYTWYGANSISYALQVVDVTNGLPFVSATSGESLRIYIDLKSGQSGTDIDNAEFTIYLNDYSFANNVRTSTTQGSANIDVKHSGFYEISVPTSYDSSAGGKIIVSFNAEYCRALLRHRCGDPTSVNILKQKATNTNTIFPIGKREYDFQAGTMNDRCEWYAPRVNVCRDMAYHPATIVSVTDPGLGLNTATNMVVQNITWNVMAGKTDQVMLKLERDESIKVGSLTTHLFDPNNIGMQFSSHRRDVPPPNITDSLDPIPPSNTPSTDGTPTLITGGTNDTKTGVGEHKVSINQYSRGSFGRIKGRMSFNDLGNSKLAVLGQNRTGATPTAMLGIEGGEGSIIATGGSAALTADGYVFGGKGLVGTADSVASSQRVSLQTQFVTPENVVNDDIIVTAKVSCGSINTSQTAVLETTVTNTETGASVTGTASISTNTDRKTIDLIPSTTLAGISTPKTRLEVVIVRKPGTGSDNANTQSVILHNLDVRMNRAATPTASKSAQFSTFS